MYRINRDMVVKVLAHIEQDLNRLEMREYAIQEGGDFARSRRFEDANWPACGTKACFAGWTVLLDTPQERWGELFAANNGLLPESVVWARAKELLNFSESQAQIVFISEAVGTENTKEQLRLLKQDLNDVLRAEGQEEV